jgi:hypothetical protein
LKEGDDSSVPYWYDDIDNVQTYTSSSSVVRDVKLYPFDSLLSNDNISNAKFVSDDSGAFAWYNYEDSPLEIKVPWNIVNNVIEYTPVNYTYDSVGKGFLGRVHNSIEEVMNPGLNKYHYKYEVIKSQVSYILTLIDVKTNEERQFEGKWSFIQPTGNFEFVRND